ncbi:MAG: hypothetical protein J6C64_00730 [Lachnospiraceae bacterium]|nr:hypothetical protein [Lachnospiraceae bacterium]
MAVNETIITGRKFRKLIDKPSKLWQRYSFWTKASDVEFNDGKTAQEKLGAIDGITDNLELADSAAARMAVSAKAANTLKTELNNVKQAFQDGCRRIVDALTAKGSTPATNSVNDIIAAINSINSTKDIQVYLKTHQKDDIQYVYVKIVTADGTPHECGTYAQGEMEYTYAGSMTI